MSKDWTFDEGVGLCYQGQRVSDMSLLHTLFEHGKYPDIVDLLNKWGIEPEWTEE